MLMKNENQVNHSEIVNPNGSLLNPTVITICNSCSTFEDKEVKHCPECGSADVEHIQE